MGQIRYALVEAENTNNSVVARSTDMASRISAKREAATLSSEGVATADSATRDAIIFVERNFLPENPNILFSDDGILALQWQSGDYGAALLFVGDGIASIALRKPGQYYAQNGIDIGIEDDLPAQFLEVLARIVR